MNKILSYLVVFIFVFVLGVSTVSAAPTNNGKGTNNPNVVSYYPSGIHTVILPNNTIVYGLVGADVVHKAGPNFQQFYTGLDGKSIHTRFHNVGDDTSCNANGLLLVNPYDPAIGDTWGYHFTPGDNYCAYSN